MADVPAVVAGLPELDLQRLDGIELPVRIRGCRPPRAGRPSPPPKPPRRAPRRGRPPGPACLAAASRSSAQPSGWLRVPAPCVRCGTSRSASRRRRCPSGSASGTTAAPRRPRWPGCTRGVAAPPRPAPPPATAGTVRPGPPGPPRRQNPEDPPGSPAGHGGTGGRIRSWRNGSGEPSAVNAQRSLTFRRKIGNALSLS